MQQEATVITKDKQVISIDFQLFQYHSKLFSNLTYECSQLPIEIDKQTLLEIEGFLKKKGLNQFSPIPKPIPSSRLNSFLQGDDLKFIQDLTWEQNDQILQAATYLEIPHIQQLCLTKIGAELIGMTANEMTQKFGIQTEYTPELEEQLKKEYKHMLQGCQIEQ